MKHMSSILAFGEETAQGTGFSPICLGVLIGTVNTLDALGPLGTNGEFGQLVCTTEPTVSQINTRRRKRL